ncbi:hypothetical protein HanRHA438_Chr17g0803981 [Helianthus annuus]|nr:hypothetical protein HanIR_Chr17g0861231 [Helianthus annuus]KAJ0825507.1 hypothetical protein HanRHA438_Chr17g0803981 [Helianthus annuus]
MVEKVNEANGSTKLKKKKRKTILYASIWKIWKTRNDCIFNSISFSILKAVDGIKDSFMWPKHRAPFSYLVWERWRDFNVRDIIV